ncbi:MAG TPA: hypothetical protein VJ872_16880 [Nocardioides sp.]|nr:hypothetical protein [Nocardioides sp.]
MAPRTVGLSLVAALVAAIGLVGISAPAAHAAGGCAYDTGVVVVVDYNGLGGNEVRKGCDPVDGHYAESNFNTAGFTLGELTTGGMAGYVCTVNGLPSDHDCTQSDAYWSLWWSDGKDGTWHYATAGVKSLKVPAGGYVGFSWDTQAGNTPPGVVPTPRQAKPTPTPSPTHAPTATPTHHHAAAAPTTATTTAPASSAPATPTTTTAATAAAKAKKHHHLPVETPAPLPSTPTATSSLPTIDQVTAGPPADTADHSNAGPGTLIAIGLGVLVIGGAAAVPLLRRRRG